MSGYFGDEYDSNYPDERVWVVTPKVTFKYSIYFAGVKMINTNYKPGIIRRVLAWCVLNIVWKNNDE